MRVLQVKRFTCDVNFESLFFDRLFAEIKINRFVFRLTPVFTGCVFDQLVKQTAEVMAAFVA